MLSMVTNEVKRTKLGGKMSKKQGKRQIKQQW